MNFLQAPPEKIDLLKVQDSPAGFADEIIVIFRNFNEVIDHLEWPVFQEQNKIEIKFRSLVREWKRETAFTSSVTGIATNPAYQQIIGMGPKVLPLILKELEQNPDHWFWALTAITGVDPIFPHHRGILSEMTADWLNWGREQGLKK